MKNRHQRLYLSGRAEASMCFDHRAYSYANVFSTEICFGARETGDHETPQHIGMRRAPDAFLMTCIPTVSVLFHFQAMPDIGFRLDLLKVTSASFFSFDNDLLALGQNSTYLLSQVRPMTSNPVYSGLPCQMRSVLGHPARYLRWNEGLSYCSGTQMNLQLSLFLILSILISDSDLIPGDVLHREMYPEPSSRFSLSSAVWIKSILLTLTYMLTYRKSEEGDLENKIRGVYSPIKLYWSGGRFKQEKDIKEAFFL